MSGVARGARPDAYVGLMSGTSLDGISAAIARFHPREDGSIHTELLGFTVTEYEDAQRERLRAAMAQGTAREYCMLAFDLGEWLARAATQVIVEAGVPRSEIAAIGSHGQTLWHEPPHSTWQLGEAAVIAERTQLPVVSDFRVRDVAAGGQGAPLVPIADALLFRGKGWRALQNIGGIGNVTVVPPDGDLRSLRAFDTGPGVAVLDGVVRELTGERFDRDGGMARAGSAISGVVDKLLAAPYFSAPPPKSTGRELFDARYVQAVIARCRALKPDATTEDVVATATSLTARSIADAYRRFLPEPITETLLSGGGAKNPALVEEITKLIPGIAVRSFDEEYFDGEAKEAVAFALLAKLHVDGQPGNVVGATGARGPRVLGKLTPA